MSKKMRFKVIINLLLIILTVLMLTHRSVYAGDIHDAARDGNIKKINYWLSMGVDVNAKNSDGNTPLHWAASRGHLKLGKYLLLKGAKINAKNGSGYTPLYNAAWTGRLETARFLISKGADVNSKDILGNTPLYVAARENRMELVRLLVYKGADVKAKVDRNYTSLHRIAAWGNLEIARLLISKGAVVNSKDSRGNTPLHNATSQNHLEVARLLISKHADINARSNEGFTPLSNAVDGGHMELAEFLILFGAKVNTKTKRRGYTPLHVAVWSGAFAISDLLISEEADIEVRDVDGRTPLDWAVTGFKKDTIKLLISEGADVNARDNNFNTPLHHIAKEMHQSGTSTNLESIAWLLILNGAEVNAVNKSGKTPESLSGSYPIYMRNMIDDYCKAAKAAKNGGYYGSFQTKPGDRNLRLALKFYIECTQRMPEVMFWLSNVGSREEIFKIIYDDNILPPAIPEKVENHIKRARTIIKAAKNRMDFLEASREIHSALIVAPWFAEGYLYHGAILDKAGKYRSAINSLQLYLLAKPNDYKAKKLINQIKNKRK